MVVAMPTSKFDSIISDILVKEGGSKVTDDPSDKGGLTQFGLTKRDNPVEWADGKVTEEEARARYMSRYVEGPGFDKIPDSHAKLRSQLIDYGVNSGPAVAIQKVQALVGAEVDGVLGQETLAAISAADPLKLNNQLAVARLEMLCKICQKNPSQLKFLVGWVRRASGFIV